MMSKKLIALQEEFLRKQRTLKNAKKVLKDEFIGIDNIIDEIIDNVSSWFTLSSIQEKPLLINLWGLTGVGKTSLVIRLAQLLNFQDKFYKFDLGQKTGRYSFRESLEDLCENTDTSPVIIALDEFQHSRTIKGPLREEIDNDENRMIWELIDSGNVHYIDWKSGIWNFENQITTLSHLLTAGVQVEKGIVVSGQALYSSEMEISFQKNALLFVPEDMYPRIIKLANNRFNLNLLQDVKDLLLQFSGQETVVFLSKVLRIGKRPTKKSFTKSLIFIMGNVDEAYNMSSNFSADMDADDFHKQSLKITIPDIKNALQERFRYEQIARLGNIHIIYPALGKNSYLIIIKNELEKYSKSIQQLTGIKLVFNATVNKMVYQEGVYPTQGVRPIFTSIHHLIKAKLSFFLTEIINKDLTISRMSFSIQNKKLICSYYKNDSFLFKKQTDINTPLEDLRKNKLDDTQAITAVHESGHAILSAILLQTIPELVYSITSDANNQGFVYTNFAWKYIARKELIPRVAMMLGGYVAEELVFGKEYLTTGASSDIEKATLFLSQMFKENGMGSTPILFGLTTNQDINTYHNHKPIEEEIKKNILQALELAQSTLNNEKQLLLEMANYLSDHRKMSKLEMELMINKHTSTPINYIANGDLLYYRNHLKKSIQQNNISKQPIHQLHTISLNKE